MYICFAIVFVMAKIFKSKKLHYLLYPMILNTISMLPINLAQDLRYAYINYLTLFAIGLVVLSTIIANKKSYKKL